MSRWFAPALLVIVALAVVVTLLDSSAYSGRVVKAVVEQPGNLVAGDEVRVAGIPVGSVKSVELDEEDRHAELELRITNDEVVLKRDSEVSIRWKNLLGGPFYVDLEPGSDDAEPDDSDVIPLERTSSQVTSLDVLQPFGGRTVPATRFLIDDLGSGLADRDAIGRTLERFPSAMRSIESGLAALQGERRDDLSALIKSTGRTVAGLGRDSQALRSVVEHSAGTLRVTAARRAELRELIGTAPQTLDSTLVTTARIDRTLRKLDPLVTSLRPGARQLDPTLAALDPVFADTPPLIDDATPLLRSLKPALGSLERVAQTGTPLVRKLDPVVERADQELLPIFFRVDGETGLRTVDLVGPTFATVAAAGAEYDAEGHFLRFAPTGGEHPVISIPCQTFFLEPTVAEKIRCDALNSALDDIFGGPGT